MSKVHEDNKVLLDGYKEIIELIENNSEVMGGIYSPEELNEKVLEIADRRVNGEI